MTAIAARAVARTTRFERTLLRTTSALDALRRTGLERRAVPSTAAMRLGSRQRRHRDPSGARRAGDAPKMTDDSSDTKDERHSSA